MHAWNTCVPELLSPCLEVHLEKERAALFFFFFKTDAGFIDGLTERKLYKSDMDFIQEQANGNPLAIYLSGQRHSLSYFGLPKL